MEQIQLPDLNNYPNVTFPIQHEQKTYTLSFRWIDTFAVLDIEYDGEYLIKGQALVTGYDLIGRIKDQDKITGSIYLVHKYGASCQPLQDTFAKDYALVWTT